MPRERHIGASKRGGSYRRLLGEVFADVDALLTPAAQGELHWASVALATIASKASGKLRTPAATLPTHAGPNGMPVGNQLVAPQDADDRVLAIAQRPFGALGSGPTKAPP
jgi:Asp-tRNA(Asn)/Glu-tRNA(Gln) amidotransferase A subunit family amidase